MSENVDEPELTFEQRRAAHALAEVKDLEEKGKNEYGHFQSYVSSLPASIVMNGLGQAMAFERSNHKDNGHDHLYKIMQDWLCRKEGVFPDDTDLMKAITSNGQREYVRAQAESLAYLEWLKKFARAYLEKGG